jgi:ComF family protein
MKYRRDLGLGDALAVPLADFVDALSWRVDLVVPMPLGRKRFKERGYNQVALFAYPLALAKRWRYAPSALHRARETRTQVGLNIAERRENVQNAFVADSKQVQNKTVLIMDDVATTSATLASCAAALTQAGAQRVYALTVARALTHHSLKEV